MQEITFFQINKIKIFNAINAGAGLGLATPFTTAASVSSFLEKDCVYLDAEHLYDHIKWETFQMCALTSPPRQAQVKQVRKRDCACTKVSALAVACVSFHIKQRKKLHACIVLDMPSVKARSYQKTVCMHAICYICHI